MRPNVCCKPIRIFLWQVPPIWVLREKPVHNHTQGSERWTYRMSSQGVSLSSSSVTPKKGCAEALMSTLACLFHIVSTRRNSLCSFVGVCWQHSAIFLHLKAAFKHQLAATCIKPVPHTPDLHKRFGEVRSIWVARKPPGFGKFQRWCCRAVHHDCVKWGPNQQGFMPLL